jgi:protein SCO1/2
LSIIDHRKMIRLATALACVLLIASLAAWYASRTNTPDPPSPSIGNVLNRPVPRTIADLPFEDQTGHPVTLRQFLGRTVLLAPFLTSCQEECPITTGALLLMKQSLVQAGLSKKVVIVEVTVDPGRDNPDRMAAFARLTGSTWPLLTGSSATIAALWHYFGIWYQEVPEGSPPGINWQTHLPYTYDVDHSDGFILLNSRLHERFIGGGMVQIGSLPANLRGLLDSQGKADLRSAGGGSWNVTDGLNAIGWLLGRSVAMVT